MPDTAVTQQSAFDIGPRVTRALVIHPYERKIGSDPLYRPLKIFTRDPTTSSLEGSTAVVKVPYEPLPGPGPKGCLFDIQELEPARRAAQVDLDDVKVLINNGVEPSPANARFHQQMVYAVCSSVYSAFQKALGRHVAWGFETFLRPSDDMRLRILPHIGGMRNAFYDRIGGELKFGYYKATPEEVSNGYFPGVYYTCISHDIVAHEVTHALLDGLRAHFMVPTNVEVLAFHEGFADLVAIFQHFSYGQMLRAALRRCRGDLNHSRLLAELATEFGHTTGRKGPLRTGIDAEPDADAPKQYNPAKQGKYELGTILVSALFEAFSSVFRRKTERYVRLATNGSGILPMGEIPEVLLDLLADEAGALANQFLSICIRAIDYCPPVDLRFGDFLRALVTADYNLVPDDPYGYREAIIQAFSRRGIFPQGVDHLSQDELRWRRPNRTIDSIAELSFASLRFRNPQEAASAEEVERQATELGKVVTRPDLMDEFGLVPPGPGVDKPCIESIRSSRRAGPDGQMLFDLIAEVTQRKTIQANGKDQDFFGGSTIIIDPGGNIRCIVSKSLRREDRIKDQLAFVEDPRAARLWVEEDGKLRGAPNVFAILDDAALSD